MTNTYKKHTNADSINDFDFAVYSTVKPSDNLYNSIETICNTFDISLLLNPTHNSLSRKSKKYITYSYDISKSYSRIRILKNKLISIDVIISEKFILSSKYEYISSANPFFNCE